MADEEIREVELWDLVSAFGRIMRDSQAARPSNIVYDDTPIHVYMAQIQARLNSEERLTFQKLFHEGMHKSALVGVFLAVLELVRNYHVRTEQNELFGEIWILPGEGGRRPKSTPRSSTITIAAAPNRKPPGRDADGASVDKKKAGATDKPARQIRQGPAESPPA